VEKCTVNEDLFFRAWLAMAAIGMPRRNSINVFYKPVFTVNLLAEGGSLAGILPGFVYRSSHFATTHTGFGGTSMASSGLERFHFRSDSALLIDPQTPSTIYLTNVMLGTNCCLGTLKNTDGGVNWSSPDSTITCSWRLTTNDAVCDSRFQNRNIL
jgi:hypothetical protein